MSDNFNNIYKASTAYEVRVEVLYRSTIDNLISMSPLFNFLKNGIIDETYRNYWNMNDTDAYCVQVMFIGKTGYGKSTTLNKICGKKIFETDDIDSCTKKIYSAEYKINRTQNYYLSLCDLPGIGESDDIDKEYIKLYSNMLDKSACVVYLLRCDTRDLALDINIIESLLKENGKLSEKLVIGLNFADEIKPKPGISTFPFIPNSEQMENLKRKVQATALSLKVPDSRIMCYSATKEYNFKEILEKISYVLKNNKYFISNSHSEPQAEIKIDDLEKKQCRPKTISFPEASLPWKPHEWEKYYGRRKRGELFPKEPLPWSPNEWEEYYERNKPKDELTSDSIQSTRNFFKKLLSGKW